MIGTLLAHPSASASTLPRILEIYDTLRRPFAQSMVVRSRRSSQLLFDEIPRAVSLGQEHKVQELGEELEDNWKWCWTTTFDADLEMAVDMLKSEASVTPV